jgi:hypothetical protein
VVFNFSRGLALQAILIQGFQSQPQLQIMARVLRLQVVHSFAAPRIPFFRQRLYCRPHQFQQAICAQ